MDTVWGTKYSIKIVIKAIKNSEETNNLLVVYGHEDSESSNYLLI